jgi:hypothetical protein
VRYEHLIEINNPLLPLLDPLERNDLWQGLVQRAYAPQDFILGLEGAHVTMVASEGAVTRLHRTLDYGAFQVDDTVTLHEDAVMITEVPGDQGLIEARLTITIEEPAAGRLYLRFLYELDQEESAGELAAVTAELRKQAYFAADMDTVARIRELAAKRRLQ